MEAGCEAAVHAVRETFAQDDTEAALLIDASNAFNSANRRCTIQNIAILCPSFFIFLVNTYRVPIRLFIPAWKKEILSLEGTTQGDPAAMGMYALSVMPLIKELSRETLVQGKTSSMVGHHRSTWAQIWLPPKCAQNRTGGQG